MTSFHDDTKFCPSCAQYVRYLSSIEHSYCIECGGEVRLLSDSDWSRFQTRLESRKPKGGRPRKDGLRRRPAAKRAAA